VLEEAPALLCVCGGPRTTPSGSTGLAGAIMTQRVGPTLGPDARLLIVISETKVPQVA
jgi:hypothetical protein